MLTFWPKTLYTYKYCFVVSLDSRFVFWLMIISIVIAVLLVCASSIISYRCLLPIGTNSSTIFNSVSIDSFTDFLGIILGSFIWNFSFISFDWTLPINRIFKASNTLPRTYHSIETSTIGVCFCGSA